MLELYAMEGMSGKGQGTGCNGFRFYVFSFVLPCRRSSLVVVRHS